MHVSITWYPEFKINEQPECQDYFMFCVLGIQ